LFHHYLNATPLGYYQVSASVSFCDFGISAPARDSCYANLKLYAKAAYNPEWYVDKSLIRSAQAGLGSPKSCILNCLQKIS
jgi:hypothetical protein